MSDKKPEGEAKHAEGKAEEAHAGGGGGIKALLPLIIMVVLMPVLAFTTTQFLVIPKVVAARGGADAHAAGGGEHGEAAAEGHGEKAAEHGEKADKGHGEEKKDAGAHGKDAKDAGAHGKAADAKSGGGKKKQSVPITKVIVNVAGSSGSRYLMTSFTLAGTNPDFKTLIEENKDQLLDLANTSLASKTINDLEKPGARNQIRAELISIFNNALGGGTVQEIYFTEFAVQ